MKDPRLLVLSVVIPAYNAELSVGRAIASAFECGATEVLVVDDGSADATSRVASESGATVLSQKNSGAFAARRAGAAASSGELLIFLDADDELIAAGVSESLKILAADNEVAVCAGTVIGVGANREVHYPIRYAPVTTATLLQQGFGPWPPAAAVVRRAAYERAAVVSPRPLSPRFAEDYELLIRLSLVGRISVHALGSARYQLVGGKSATSTENAIRSKEEIRAYYSAHSRIPVSLMTENQIVRAGLIRKARAQFSSGQKARAMLTMSKWALRDPLGSARKLAGKPWRRN